MVHRYSAQQLILLRGSPLVVKPDNLPPAEEWMGPPADQQSQRKAQAGRNKTDEATALEGSSRRPAMFENRHISRGSTTAGEDIVLGPPKLAFTSAMSSRSFGKASDLPERRRVPSREDDASIEPDHARDRGPRDKLDRSDRGGDRERARDGKLGMNGARRGLKDEGDGWTSVKPRKSFGQEDDDRGGRRNGERESREYPPRAMGSFEHHHNRDRDRDRETDREVNPRRNGMGRARNELSWFKDRDQQTPKDEPPPRDAPRSREWREKDPGPDRDWSRSAANAEKDPEWMDTPAPEEKKSGHTQEDFQRWKEKMKAGSVPTELKSVPAEAVDAAQRTASGASKSQKAGTPLFMDKSEDKFFEMWNQPKQPAEASMAPSAPDAPPKPVSKMAQGKASRFTSFFAPQEEPQSQPPPPQFIPAEAGHLQSSNPEDQEGFQRILQMLGGASIVPQQPPSYQQSQALERRQPQSPMNEARHMDQRSQVESHQNEPVDDSRSRFSQFSSTTPPKTKDMEFFQGLMHQNAAPHIQQHHNSLESEFYSSYPNRGQSARRSSPPPQSQSQPQPQNPYPDFHQRRPEQGPSSTHPTILRRPPGLDQAPAGWPNPQQAPSSHGHGIAPPPGLSSLPQSQNQPSSSSTTNTNGPNSSSNGNNNSGGGRNLPPFPGFPVPPPGMFPSHQDLANLPPPPPGFYMNGLPPPPHPPPPGYPHLLGFPPGMMGPPRQAGQGGFDMFGPSAAGIEAANNAAPQQGHGGRGPPPG